jgi:hypothetical protein
MTTGFSIINIPDSGEAREWLAGSFTESTLLHTALQILWQIIIIIIAAWGNRDGSVRRNKEENRFKLPKDEKPEKLEIFAGSTLFLCPDVTIRRSRPYTVLSNLVTVHALTNQPTTVLASVDFPARQTDDCFNVHARCCTHYPGYCISAFSFFRSFWKVAIRPTGTENYLIYRLLLLFNLRVQEYPPLVKMPCRWLDSAVRLICVALSSLGLECSDIAVDNINNNDCGVLTWVAVIISIFNLPGSRKMLTFGFDNTDPNLIIITLYRNFTIYTIDYKYRCLLDM